MLWSWCQVEAFVGIGIEAIAGIVGIDVISNGMDYIDIDATRRIHDLDKAIQSNPRIIVNGDTKILIDSQTAEANGVMVISVTGKISLVQFHCSVIRNIDIE